MQEQGGGKPGDGGAQLYRRWRGGGAGRLVLVETGDLDGDGQPEIAACAGRQLKVFDWTGDTYLLRHEESLPRDGLAIALGKIDPGGPGLLLVGTKDNVMLYAWTERGLNPLCQTLLFPNAYFRSIALSDVNGDGRAEVVAAASGAQTMYIFQVMSIGGETRLEELGRLYLGGLVSVRGAGTGEVAAATRDGFVDVFVPCSLLPKEGHAICTVRRGDSLWRLARKYGTSPGAIARANRLSEPYLLTPGQVLIIPGATKPRPE